MSYSYILFQVVELVVIVDTQHSIHLQSTPTTTPIITTTATTSTISSSMC